MALVPQSPASAADIERELAAVKKIVALRPNEWLGRKRGSKSADGFYTDASYWEAYPEATPKIAVGDDAAIAAYNRIALLVQGELEAALPPNPNYDPSGLTWPLKSAPKAPTAGGSFGAKRPFGGTQTRWHAGTDLGAPVGAAVLAPESGTVVAANSGWDYDSKTGKGVKAIIIASDSGRTWLLGGIRPNSATVKAGARVKAGDKVAEVGAYKNGGHMVHVQAYDAVLTEAEVNKRKSWPKDGPRPANLIDAGPLLELAGKNTQVGFFPFPEADDADVSAELAEGLEEALAAAKELADQLNPSSGSSALPWIIGGLAAAGLVAGLVIVSLPPAKPARARRRAA